MFYKTHDKSAKAVKKEQVDEPESDQILRKNIKMMLLEIDNLSSIERQI